MHSTVSKKPEILSFNWCPFRWTCPPTQTTENGKRVHTIMVGSLEDKEVASEHLSLDWQIFLQKDGARMEPENKMTAAMCLEMEMRGERKEKLQTPFYPSTGDK